MGVRLSVDLNNAALLAALTSPYVEKQTIWSENRPQNS